MKRFIVEVRKSIAYVFLTSYVQMLHALGRVRTVLYAIALYYYLCKQSRPPFPPPSKEMTRGARHSTDLKITDILKNLTIVD